MSDNGTPPPGGPSVTAGGPPSMHVTELGRVGLRVGRTDGAEWHDLPLLRLPDADGPLVLRTSHDAARSRGYEACVRMWATLSPRLGRRLAEVADWPVRLVHDDDGPAGIVMARPPAAHRQRMRLPSGDVRTVGRTLDLLMVAAPTAEWLELPMPDTPTRLAICRSLAEHVRLLHELGITLPGLAARDVTVALGAEPEVRFQALDLSVGDAATDDDLHVLGLLVLRCLTPGPFRSVAREPDGAVAMLDAAGLVLLRRAIDGPPSARPTADEWARVLATQPDQRAMPPVLDVVEADRALVAAGDTILVRWVGTGVDTIAVEGPACPPTRVTVAGGSGEIAVVPHRSGPLVVTASSRFGSTEQEVGRIAVHDVARMGDLSVPVPRLDWPALDAPDLPDLRPVMPPAPDLTVMHLPDRGALDNLLTGAAEPAGPSPFPQVAPPPDVVAGRSALPVDLIDLLSAAPAFPSGARRRWRPFRRRVTK